MYDKIMTASLIRTILLKVEKLMYDKIMAASLIRTTLLMVER